MPHRNLYRRVLIFVPSIEIENVTEALNMLVHILGPLHATIARSGSRRADAYYQCVNGRYSLICTDMLKMEEIYFELLKARFNVLGEEQSYCVSSRERFSVEVF